MYCCWINLALLCLNKNSMYRYQITTTLQFLSLENEVLKIYLLILQEKDSTRSLWFPFSCIKMKICQTEVSSFSIGHYFRQNMPDDKAVQKVFRLVTLWLWILKYCSKAFADLAISNSVDVVTVISRAIWMCETYHLRLAKQP